jgi:toxin ParE1/3/4
VKIIYSKNYKNSVIEISNYYSEAGNNLAQKFMLSIRQSVYNLKQSPMMGRDGRVKDTRELVLYNFPYFISYRVNKDVIEIIDIMHTARDYPNKLN